jgi:hypothetical protein
MTIENKIIGLRGVSYVKASYEFIPTEAGQFGYSCWMGMIRSSIIVTE